MDSVINQFFTVMSGQQLLTIVCLGVSVTILYVIFSYF